MTHYPHLLLDIQQHTALVTISNPPANTWNADSLNGLIELVHELNANRDIYALVLTGEGSKFFSAGADLNMFADGDPAVAASTRSPHRIMRLAQPSPTSQGRFCVPPAQGKRPTVASGSAICAWVSAMRKSQASATSRPPPMA